MVRDGDGTARLRKVRQGEPYLLHDGSGVTDAQLTGALARANGEVSSLKSELAKEPKFPVLLLNCYTFPNADVAAATAARVEGVFATLFADNLREIARTDATEARQLPLTRGTLQHWLDENVIRTGGWNAGLMTGNKGWADEQIALAEADPAAQAVARPPLPPFIPPHPLALLRLRRPASVARSLAAWSSGLPTGLPTGHAAGRAAALADEPARAQLEALRARLLERDPNEPVDPVRLVMLLVSQ